MKEKVIYCAGFVDGEGSISFCGRALTLAAYQSVIEPLELLKELFGGNIYKTEKNNQKLVCFMWKVSSRQAENTIKELYPYLIVKKKQAELALNYYSGEFVSGRKLDTKELERRSNIIKQIRSLNYGKDNERRKRL